MADRRNGRSEQSQAGPGELRAEERGPIKSDPAAPDGGQGQPGDGESSGNDAELRHVAESARPRPMMRRERARTGPSTRASRPGRREASSGQKNAEQQGRE